MNQRTQFYELYITKHTVIRDSDYDFLLYRGQYIEFKGPGLANPVVCSFPFNFSFSFITYLLFGSLITYLTLLWAVLCNVCDGADHLVMKFHRFKSAPCQFCLVEFYERPNPNHKP